jgi:hypothetical protein
MRNNKIIIVLAHQVIICSRVSYAPRYLEVAYIIMSIAARAAGRRDESASKRWGFTISVGPLSDPFC